MLIDLSDKHSIALLVSLRKSKIIQIDSSVINDVHIHAILPLIMLRLQPDNK